MVNYWNMTGTLSPVDDWGPGCWVRMITPETVETDDVVSRFGVPRLFMGYLADADERARYDREDGWTMIVIRIPYAKPTRSRTPYITVPMGVIFKDDVVITVCNFHVSMIDDFINERRRRGCGMVDVTDLVFHLIFMSAVYFLKYLKQINQLIEQSKRDLDRSIDNSSLIALSRLQDSLTYFETSIRGNESLVAKLKTKLPIDELDSDLIEDIDIELGQARETALIYSTILDSTMDTYSSVINNNVNTVMRVLASVSIILMLPTLVASFMGMNLINGMEESRWGFPLIMLCSLLLALACWLYFRHKKLV